MPDRYPVDLPEGQTTDIEVVYNPGLAITAPTPCPGIVLVDSNGRETMSAFSDELASVIATGGGFEVVVSPGFADSGTYEPAFLIPLEADGSRSARITNQEFDSLIIA